MDFLSVLIQLYSEVGSLVSLLPKPDNASMLNPTLALCGISYGVTYLNGYVLFAANIEDFKRIARKLGSEKFMDQLAQIANEPAFESFTHKSINRNKRVKNILNKQENERKMKKPIARQSEPKLSLNLNDGGTKIDFEELVDRVKQRLENEFSNNYQSQHVHDTKKDVNTNRNKVTTKVYIQIRPKKKLLNKSNVSRKSTTRTTPKSPIIDDIDYDYEDAVAQNENGSHERIDVKVEPTRENTDPMYADAMIYEESDKTTKYHSTVNAKYDKYQNNSKIYYDNIYDYETKQSTNVNRMKDNNLIFKKIQIMKEGSYEDYVTPAKERNIFVSNEKITSRNRYKIQNRLKITTDYKPEANTEYIDAVTIGSEEIKARTEMLWYDDKDYNDTKIISDERSQGTGVPTRETYKMVTPNYYASLPTIAERYDFNEPLPERDRERENIKYIRNPPARINKKIRLL